MPKQQAEPTRTVLALDDNALVVSVYQKTLEALGYEVIDGGRDFEQQLGVLETGRYDVIITDLIGHAVLDGIPYIRRLKEICPDCPLIVVSGSRLTLSERCPEDATYLASVAFANVDKPFLRSEVVDAVDRAFTSLGKSAG